jgi:hypothetical protein
MLSDVICQPVTGISLQAIGPIFKGEAVQETGTDKFTRNISNQVTASAS